MVKIRPVRQDDCLLLWEWANDPEVRRWSFDPDPIPMDTHIEWFYRKLSDPYCRFYMMETEDNRPIGQVRFDFQEDGTAVISFSVQEAARGFGYGSSALKEATQLVFKEHIVAKVVALCLPENRASLRAFEKAGFHHDGRKIERGQVGVRMTLARAEIEDD